MRAEIEKSPLLKVIYFHIVGADSLLPVEDWNEAANLRGCAAVQADAVRLIDNIDFKI